MDKPESEPSSASVASESHELNGNEQPLAPIAGFKICTTKLLTDVPETIDRFEGQPHRKVAEAIAELILAPKPQGITIGLEGNWGAGKTTVVRLLKGYLEANKKIRLISFDAWAHEGDPLRWTFLETLIRDLQKDKWIKADDWDNTLEELANRREVTTVKDTPVLKKFGKAFAVSLLLVPIGAALFSSALRENITLKYTGHLAWAFLIEFTLGLMFSLAPLIAYLIFKDDNKEGIWELLANKGILEKRTETNKTANPTSIEFENKFKLMMSEALKDGEKRIVLIVDNLDRVEAKDALSIWSTLQTFLQYRADNTTDWSNRLWLLALYDLKGLSLLWKGGSESKEEVSNIGEVAASFMDKNFQIRFEVPPPVLSDWRKFLIEQLKDAFEDHKEIDFHEAYRVLAIHLGNAQRLPTIRELKLYVNQIGSIHRQWAANEKRKEDTFPLSHIAYYVILRRENKDVVKELLRPDFPDKEYKDLLGNEINVNLAAMAFNVEAKIAQQLLITDKIKSALSSGSSSELKEFATLPRGFWELLEQIVETEWQGAEAIKIADAAHALDESELFEKATRPETIQITKAMCRTAVNVQSWQSLDMKKAQGLVVLLRWKRGISKNGDEYINFLITTFRAIAIGLKSDPESKIDLNVQEWIQYLSVILDRLTSDEKKAAVSEVVNYISAELSANNFTGNKNMVAFLEVLAELRFHSEVAAIAQVAVEDLAENGHILHQLSNEAERSISSMAWGMYILLGQDKPINKPSPEVGESDRGYKNVMKWLADGYRGVTEQFTAILAHYRQLDRLFELKDTIPAPRLFIDQALRVALEKYEFLSAFENEKFADRLSYLDKMIGDTESEREPYQKLIKNLLQGPTLVDTISRSTLNPQFGRIYKDIADSGAIHNKTFKDWAIREVQSLDESVWLNQLTYSGPIVELAKSLQNSVPGVTLGQEFFNALVAFARSITAGETATILELGIINELPIDLLGKTPLREELRRILLDLAVQFTGDIPEYYFTIFGEEIAHPQLLKENLPIIEQLFISLLKAENLAGLNWIKTIIEDPAHKVTFEAQLQSFKQKVGKAWLEASTAPPMTDEIYTVISQIAASLKIKLPQRGKIAFSSMREDGWEIYVMDEDGRNQNRLTYLAKGATGPMPSQSNQPTWSPDGKRIAFTATFPQSPAIYVMDANGENQMRLTHSPQGSQQAAWSPDGKRIAFIRVGETRGDVYIMDADGTNERRLTDDLRQNEFPSWSPDSKMIAFHSVGVNEPFQIHIMDADGNNRRSISSPSAHDVEPDWSPDGTEIVFRSNPFIATNTGQLGIFIMNIDGSNRRLISPQVDGARPVWSPDGRKIAFIKRLGINANIFVMDKDGSNIKQLTQVSGNMDPRWQPGVLV